MIGSSSLRRRKTAPQHTKKEPQKQRFFFVNVYSIFSFLEFVFYVLNDLGTPRSYQALIIS